LLILNPIPSQFNGCFPAHQPFPSAISLANDIFKDTQIPVVILGSVIVPPTSNQSPEGSVCLTQVNDPEMDTCSVFLEHGSNG
jgi:hypothetical protein